MRKPDSNSVIIVRAGVACVVGTILALVFNAMNSVNLQNIAEGYANENFCTVSSDGSCLIIDTNPLDIEEYTESGSREAIAEINKRLNVPEYVYEHMSSTRAIDGMQSYEDDNINIRWTFHPDNGLEIIYSSK